MDLKKETARAAFVLIKNHGSIGLGTGRTIASLVEFIGDGICNGLDIDLYTCSSTTRQLLEEKGIRVNDIAKTERLDQYFDGCDLVDEHLNALKSGAGIHTLEKIFASMAGEFILLAEESKFVSRMDPKIPLVLEVIPQAISWVIKKMNDFFSPAEISIRESASNEEYSGRPGCTRLLDVKFKEWLILSLVQEKAKNIPGVIDISLFYQIAHKAIIAGQNQVRFFERAKIGLLQ